MIPKTKRKKGDPQKLYIYKNPLKELVIRMRRKTNNNKVTHLIQFREEHGYAYVAFNAWKIM